MDNVDNAILNEDEKVRRVDEALERFEALIADELKTIDMLSAMIRRTAINFEGEFDFSEEAHDMLREIV